MERGNNKRVRKSVSPLGLEDWVPIRDVRKLIWNHLNPIDKLMVWSAHGVHTYLEREVYWFRRQLVRYGYLELLLSNTDGEKAVVTKLIHHGKSKHLHMIKWIAENDFEHFDSITISKYAAKRGHLDILKYIHSLGLPLIEDVYVQGAKGGHIEIFMWVKDLGYKISNYVTLYVAIDNGHTKFLNWYLNNTDLSEVYQYQYYLYTLVCYKNNFDMFKILINHGFNFDKRDCLLVVVQGSEIHTWILNNT